jgi:hypothetical protein
MCLTWLNPLVVSTVKYVKDNGWDAKTKKFFMISSAITFIILLAYVVAHSIIDATGQYDLDPKWRASLEKCLLKKGITSISKRNIQSYNLYTSGSTLLPYGAFAGHCFKSQKRQNDPDWAVIKPNNLHSIV